MTSTSTNALTLTSSIFRTCSIFQSCQADTSHSALRRKSPSNVSMDGSPVVIRKLDADGSPEVVVDTFCMETAAGRKLGCTANDIRLASANVIDPGDGCNNVINPDGTVTYDTVTFTAEWEV